MDSIKTKCKYCDSTLCLKITDTQGNIIKFQCFNCGKEFDVLLPFQKLDQDPEEMVL